MSLTYRGQDLAKLSEHMSYQDHVTLRSFWSDPCKIDLALRMFLVGTESLKRGTEL